jgi:hypothetical protein
MAILGLLEENGDTLKPVIFPEVIFFATPSRRRNNRL